MTIKRELKDSDRFWIETGIDIRGRKIFLDDEICNINIGFIIRAIQRMMAENDQEPVDIYINSPGGNINDGLALYDVLESLEVTVRTHALGQVSSMAFILFLVGDERYASKRVRFMHHEGMTFVEGSYTSISNDIKELGAVEDMCHAIVEERTGIKKKWWQNRVLGKNFFIGYEEALELHIITEKSVKPSL